MALKLAPVFALSFALAACAPSEVKTLPNSTFQGTDGREHTLIDPDAKFTVIEIFSVHCKCQTKHDERLKALAREFEGRGVKFVAIDPEDGASVERDRSEVEKRGYPYPILIDPHGTFARTFGAEYATFSVIVDREGRVLYRGGIDSDMHDMSEHPTQFLKEALLDVVSGEKVRRPAARTLGCALNLE